MRGRRKNVEIFNIYDMTSSFVKIKQILFFQQQERNLFEFMAESKYIYEECVLTGVCLDSNLKKKRETKKNIKEPTIR